MAAWEVALLPGEIILCQVDQNINKDLDCSRCSICSEEPARRTSGKKARGLERKRALPLSFLDPLVLALASFPFRSPPQTKSLEQANKEHGVKS